MHGREAPITQGWVIEETITGGESGDGGKVGRRAGGLGRSWEGQPSRVGAAGTADGAGRQHLEPEHLGQCPPSGYSLSAESRQARMPPSGKQQRTRCQRENSEGAQARLG